MGDPKTYPSAVGLPSAAKGFMSQQRPKDIADAAQGADTWKGDLVADEAHRKNLERQAEALKVQAAIDDKFGPSLADLKSQASFIVTETAEIKRKATPAGKTPATAQAPSTLGAIAMAFFAKRKE